jgi:hypothetical protein
LKAGKILFPLQKGQADLNQWPGQGFLQGPDIMAVKWRKGLPVPDKIIIDLGLAGIPGMKGRFNFLNSADKDISGQKGLESPLYFNQRQP